MRTLVSVATGSATFLALVVDVASCDGSAKGVPGPGPAPAGYVNCVDVLRLSRSRGISVANVHRFGTDTPGLRAGTRLTDLAPTDVAAFCDWEACLRTNGYAHACTVAEAGIEPCRVCADAGDDCDGFPRSQSECVAGIRAEGRATCHLGLLEDCLIQRAIRGFGDERRTLSCEARRARTRAQAGCQETGRRSLRSRSTRRAR